MSTVDERRADQQMKLWQAAFDAQKHLNDMLLRSLLLPLLCGGGRIGGDRDQRTRRDVNSSELMLTR